MRINNDNGLVIEAHQDGRRLTYQVVKQSNEATRALSLFGLINDDSGFSLRANKYPSYNKKTKRFFVRGTQKAKDNERVEIDFKSIAEAQQALQALTRLAGAVRMPDVTDPNHKDEIARPQPGGTTHV